MIRRDILRVFLVCIIACNVTAQNQRQPERSSTRPPEDNERGLRELTAEEIPPNLNFYVMDPLYEPNAILGWSKVRVEEKLNRGMLAVSMEGGKIYLGWRLLKSDPENIAFNVYRSTAGGAAIKLNSQPITETTDFIDDDAPLDKLNNWWVKPFVNNQELEASKRAELAAN